MSSQLNHAAADNDNGPAFQSSWLYPSVSTTKTDDQNIAIFRSAPVAISTQQWENHIENVAFKTGQSLKHPEQKAARSEAIGVSAALLSAAQSIGGFDQHLPPSRQSMNEMLNQQSLILRSALRNTAFLRNAVEKTYERYDKMGSEIDKDDVTLGEMRIAAEYKLVATSLKEKNKQLKTVLELEREARKAVEQELKELKRKYSTISSSK